MLQYKVYVLKSIHHNKHYIGQTANLKNRIIEHNLGLSQYTRKYLPWTLLYYEVYPTRSEAIKREKYFKSYKGRKWLFQNILLADTNPISD